MHSIAFLALLCFVTLDAQPPALSPHCHRGFGEKEGLASFFSRVCCRGYELAAWPTWCRPQCLPRCPAHADCVAPNVCACRVGYIEAADGTCTTICSEAFVWNSKIESCESRCHGLAKWDASTRSCVEILETQVEFLAAEVNLLVPQVENSVHSNEDDQTEILTLPTAAAYTQSQLVALVGGAAAIPENETTERSEPEDLVDWFDDYINLLVFFILITPLALGFLLLYIWKVRPGRSREIEVFEVKHDLYTEYELDRSRIMVY